MWEHSRSNTAPISPTAVLLVMLLVSWPGRQNDEVSREMIPICSSDYFPNSHLILPTTHQRGGERARGSRSHGGGRQRRGEERKNKEGEDGEDQNQDKHGQTVETKGERQSFQFQGDEKIQWSVLYDQREWLVICSPVHKTVSTPADEIHLSPFMKCTTYIICDKVSTLRIIC